MDDTNKVYTEQEALEGLQRNDFFLGKLKVFYS